jgi:hypothetical protein
VDNVFVQWPWLPWACAIGADAMDMADTARTAVAALSLWDIEGSNDP